MEKRNRRMKASEVAAQHPRWLATPTSDFSKAFPTIAEVRIDVVSRFTPSGEEREYSTRSEPREFIDCTNPRCYNGGVPLGHMLRGMVEGRKTEEQWSPPCQGYEGSPKGRRQTGPCDNHFTVKVTLRFKDESSEEG